MDLVALGRWSSWWAPCRCLACGEPRPRGPWPLCIECGEGCEPLEHAPWGDRRGVPVVAGYRYGGAIADALTRMKFDGAAPGWGELLAPWATAFDHAARELRIDALVAVPPHAGRLRQRGWHLPDLLATTLACRSGVRVQLCLERRDDQAPRALAASTSTPTFAIRDGREVAGSRIALVDDVVTTGATASSAVAALRRGGAEVVLLATLADARPRDAAATAAASAPL